MAKHELKSRFGPWDSLKWRLMRGEKIVLPWPEPKEVTINDKDINWSDCGGATNVSLFTDDPNYHLRPFLEEKIGIQGKDWMWRHQVGCSVFITPEFHRQVDRLEIKIRKNKSKWASVIRLKWGNSE